MLKQTRFYILFVYCIFSLVALSQNNKVVEVIMDNRIPNDVEYKEVVGGLHGSFDRPRPNRIGFIGRDSPDSLSILLKPAKEGDPQAQFILAIEYYYADKYGKCWHWINESANNGFVCAMLELGSYYRCGKFSWTHFEQPRKAKINLAKSLKWYQKAANLNDPWGEYAMGQVYEYGFGVDVDLEKALQWYIQSKSHGCENASKKVDKIQNSLISRARIPELLKLDKNKDDKYLQYEIARIYYNLNDTVNALDWALKAADCQTRQKRFKHSIQKYEDIDIGENGCSDALLLLGSMYETGYGVKKDNLNAFLLYQAAGLRGNAKGLYEWGCFDMISGSTDPYRKAAFIFLSEEKQQEIKRQNKLYVLGLIQEDCISRISLPWPKNNTHPEHISIYDCGVAFQLALIKGYILQDTIHYEWVFSWYEQRAEDGYADAQVALGKMYYSGLGVEKNEKKAIEWWRKAAQQGQKRGLTYMGEVSVVGIGDVAKNLDSAMYWYNILVERYNDDQARYAISEIEHLKSIEIASNSKPLIKWGNIPQKVKTEKFEISATLLSNSEMIDYQVLLNGEVVPLIGNSPETLEKGGSFSPPTHIVFHDFNRPILAKVNLKPGNNVIEIKAENMSGETSEYKTINYQLQNEQVSSSSTKSTGKRIALVIGNANYYANKMLLNNPIRDAEAIGKEFNKLGFDEVIIKKDLKTSEMRQTLDDVLKKLEVDDYEAAVLYYSGHGVSTNDGDCYLVPINQEPKNKHEVIDNCIGLNYVLAIMGECSGNSLVIIDACRNTIQEDLFKNGFTKIPELRNNANMVLFTSASPGATASDGSKGNHSPFAQSLINHLSENVPVSMVFDKVVDDVKNASNREQVPRTYGSTGLFYLYPNK